MNSVPAGLGLLKPQCFICFSSETGKRWQDHFVRTQNGHPFHYCCIMHMMVDGMTICPVCDEDLRHQTLTPIATTLPPSISSASPAALTPNLLSPDARKGTAFPSSLITGVTGFLKGNGRSPPSRPVQKVEVESPHGEQQNATAPVGGVQGQSSAERGNNGDVGLGSNASSYTGPTSLTPLRINFEASPKPSPRNKSKDNCC